MKPFKAWMIGSVIIIIPYGIRIIYDFPASYMWLGVPAMAAFITACLASKHKIALGMSMAVVKTVLSIIVLFFCMIFNIGDNIGVGGVLILATIDFIMISIVCMIASFFADFLTNRNKNYNE
ncbi:MAG: hypothetical protein LBH45_03905 [Campylobacteraceae bacterium]|jgi:hypothetical protein|nr:hypothetical protein [Campylobacteraceae bacterium]